MNFIKRGRVNEIVISLDINQKNAMQPHQLGNGRLHEPAAY